MSEGAKHLGAGQSELAALLTAHRQELGVAATTLEAGLTLSNGGQAKGPRLVTPCRDLGVHLDRHGVLLDGLASALRATDSVGAELAASLGERSRDLSRFVRGAHQRFAGAELRRQVAAVVDVLRELLRQEKSHLDPNG